MPEYLILKLDGVMQSWGEHTYEDFRPTLHFPGRSALLGLLGACLGLDRRAVAEQQALAAGVRFLVRADGDPTRPEPTLLVDFHTVMDARAVGGKVRANPVVSRREYLCDCTFTVVVDAAPELLDRLENALKRPYYTPFLGRRSCPPSRPLLESRVVAADAVEALAGVPPCCGQLYSDEDLPGSLPLRVRDEPLLVRHRQFASRQVYVSTQDLEEGDVSEQD